MATLTRPLLLALLAMTSPALAQVELVDPDAPSVRAKRPVRPAPEAVRRPAEDDAPDMSAPEDDAPDEGVKAEDVGVEDDAEGSMARPVKAPPPREPKDAGVASAPSDARKKVEGPPLAPFVVERVTDADLEQAWLRWKKTDRGPDFKAEQAARAELTSLRQAIGASDLEAWAVGLLQASRAHQKAGDSGAAVELALTATELAPALPAAWAGLAEAYFLADPSELGRTLRALFAAARSELTEPRYRRAALADVATVLLLALVLTAVVVVVVLFARRAYLVFFDFHFFFPRAAARWQTTAAALLLLSVPVVFRWGLAPVLLTLLAAATLYLTPRERLVAAGLVASLGLVPTLGAMVVEAAAFAGTSAATLAAIERGGPGVEPSVRQLESLAAEDKVGFAERYVLGRHHLRRGQMARALPHLEKALALRPEDVGARVNLGVAFFLSGDLENSRAILETVARDSRHAIALYDLGRVYQRRVAVYGELAAAEVDRAMAVFSQAAQLDSSLPRVTALDEPASSTANRLVRTVPLEPELLLAQARAGDAAEQVRSQLSLLLLGEVPAPLASLSPLVLAGLLVALGGVGPRLRVARECSRCGKAVSTRADPEVSAGSPMCTPCVNAFAKKHVVAPALKVRKQLEVARHQARMARTGVVLGALCAGMGHVFSGWPVRGALFGFAFLTAAVFAVLRHGVFRAPFDALPSAVKVAPLVVMGLVAYLVSLRELRKRQD